MFTERKKGKNKGLKIIAFFLAFALVLTGIGAFAGLEGVFSMKAKAAPGDVEINETTFPDENFRNFILEQTYGIDGILTAEEIAGVTNISCTGRSIADLTGIEYFTALTELNCNNNQLSELDVSSCTALESLSCRINNLTTLDVSSNTALTSLDCSSNNISTLDLRSIPALMGLSVGGNNLTSLSFVRNTGNTVTINGNGATFADFYDGSFPPATTAGWVVKSTSPDKPITSWTVTGTGATASVNGTKSSLLFATSEDSTFTANWTAPHTGDAYISALANEGALDVPMINKKSNFWHPTMTLYSDESQRFEAFCIDLGKHGRLGNEFWSSGAFTGDPLINKIVKAKSSGALDYKEAQVLIWGVQEGVVSDANDMTELLTQLGVSNVDTKVAAVTAASADTIYLWTNIYGTSNYQRFVSYLEPDNERTTFDPVVDPSTWYHITYDGNGNDDGTVPADTNDYQPNEYAFVKGNSGNLTKTDKVFAGWTDNAAGTGTVYTLDDLYTVTDDVTLYAKWNSSTATHNVTYNDTGATSGTAPVDVNLYNEGDTITILGNTGSLAKTGYFFKGWKEDTSGSEYYTDDAIADEIYLYGATFRDYSFSPIWEQGYEVVYNGNGNNSGVIPTDNTLYKSGESAIALGNTGNLTKTDKVFGGWNTKADGTGTPVAVGATIYPSALDADDVVDHKATLYAMWTDAAGGGGTIPITADEYTLTIREIYQDENGIVERTDVSAIVLPADETITINAAVPNGYTAVGATSQDVRMDGDKTITFTYKKNGTTPAPGGGGGTIPITAEEYTLTLTEVYQNADGSTERTTNNATTIPAGETITLTATPPAGYTVVGATTATVTMNSNKTVTFTYRKEGTAPTPPGPIDPNPPAPVDPDPPAPVERFTITFEDGLGNVILSQVVDKGAATPQPADPTREGYTFTGWSPSVAPTVTGAVTYTATWRENEKPKHNITIIEILVDEDGNVIGTSTRTIQYTEGETATIIAQSPEGYTVVGDSTVSFVVDGDKAVEFTYKKDATPDPVNPDPIDPNPPAPVDPDPVNPDPVNPDPVNPNPPAPVNPDPVNPDPNPNPGGNGGNSGGTVIPIPVTPDDGNDGNGDNGGGTPAPDNGDRNKPDNGDPTKPDNGDGNKPDPTKPDNGDKPKPDNGDPIKPDDPATPDDGDKPKPINPDEPGKPDEPDKPGDGDKIIPDDGGKTPNWLTDDTPEARAIRRNVAIGVISGGVVVTLAATGALKYLWLLLLLLLFRHKKIVFHGILEKDSKSKYVQVKSTGAEKEAIPLQNYIDLRHTANDIYEAALASGYETCLPIGTTMVFEYADRLEKMKADETKMYEVLSEAKGKVGVNLVNKAAKIDIRLNFNLD